ncbi:squamous cell carcinoma antigen recognized by T-cells 3 [Musca vetustissima]|uniref:squamous cell carcinoma antigen recognized by T-cells 3 n=1 Tax=Musca vetustissima TaxID=27455 RepID=UPI002AB7380B|nr:squamous cell carcinoma antigen recognized by T-cells 3 [Musca vetustissima]
MEDSSNAKMFDEEIDEAEEEALLKSDDENDGPKTNVSLSVLRPPSVVELMEDNSLLNGPLPIDQLDNGDDEDMSLDKEIESVDLVDGDTNGGGGADDDAGASSASDEDDDDNDDEELKALKEFQAILEELAVNQYAYDKYVRLCELSHTTGDLDNIRKAYTTFSNVYPLTPELWQRYISVELTLAQSESEVQQVKKLFQRALRDYYSCDLALEYATFAKRCTDSTAIWEEILGTYGLNCHKGQDFFKLYRQQFPEDTYRDEYIQSFLKELRYPLNQMEESYIEFKVYYEKNKELFADRQDIDWEAIDAKYFKAKEHLKKILPYEEKLQTLGANLYRERAEVYFDYIKESDKYLDENVLQTIYERMVAECCLNADCWLKYIDFIDYRDEFGRPKDLQKLPLFEQTPDDICQRALRNCTWSPELYIKRIQILEKMDRSKTEVQEVLESAAVAGFQTPEPAVTVWLEYLTYLRRHTDWTDPDECDIIRKNFNLAWTILGQQWGVLADCNCEILQFWGRLEYGPLQDPKKGKELWTTVMESADNALKSGLWIEFALLEMRRDLEATRRLFSKALNTPGLDNPLVITSAWERFERCNGNVKTLNNCLKECNTFKQQYSVQASTTFAQQKSQKSSTKTATKRKSNNQTESTSAPPSKQTKFGDEQPAPTTSQSKVGDAKKEATFKEHENQEIDLSKDHLRIFLSNLDYNLTEDEIREELPELNIVDIELIRSGNGRSRGFGYAVLPSEAEVEKALSLDRKDVRGRPVFISSVLRDKEQRQKFKYSAEMEPQKLFVKSLPNDANQKEVEDLFKPYGGLKDVRLVYHKSGKFKQIAYVEFEQEASAGKAVMALDGTEIRGHKISVAISAPPPKPTAGATTSNPMKMLGLVSKRNKVFEQKPRMSLIPMSVRKNLTNKVATPAATAAITLESSIPAPQDAPKSNADFRKFLTK